MAIALIAFPALVIGQDDRLRAERGPVDPLDGCRVPLPSGQDRDTGLAGQYISDRQGQPYLLAPSLTLRQTYTDNVTLAPEGEEEHDHITQLIPAVSFCQNRQRIRTQADYQAQILHYSEDSDRNEVLHRGNVDSTAVLRQEMLFLDMGARYDETRRGRDTVFATDNELVAGE